FLVIAMFLLLIVDRPRSINRLHRNALSSYTRNDYSSKVIGNSQNGRYKVFMETLANSDANRKIIKYAKGPAKNLPTAETSFTLS
ncbi:hypothetical protein, partial [Shewanella surugensis]